MGDDKRVSHSGRNNRSNTKVEATGPVLEVDNPFDLWYLCQKIDYARANPMQRSDGVFIFQRVVSLWIRQEARFANYHWPWVAEVGYDMTTDPPSPIMSRKDPERVSEFPLSQYSRIRSRMDSGLSSQLPELMNSSVIEITKPLSGKSELEHELIHPTQRRAGLMRIPDVIALDNFMMANGAAKFSQGNLSTVIEIKFPNDTLWRDQKDAYELIAGGPYKFRLMRTDRCNRRRRREWEEEVNQMREPAFVSVRDRVQQNSGMMNRLSRPYDLIISLIEAENLEVKRLFDSATRLRAAYEQSQRYGGHVMTAAPSAAEQARMEQQRQRARSQMEMVLAGPLAVAALGTAAVPLLAGGSGAAVTTTTSTTLSTGGRVLYTGARIAGNPTVQRIAASTAAANAPVMRAAASERTETSVFPETNGFMDPYNAFLFHNPNTYEDFFYWADSVVSYQMTDYGIVTKYR